MVVKKVDILAKIPFSKESHIVRVEAEIDKVLRFFTTNRVIHISINNLNVPKDFLDEVVEEIVNTYKEAGWSISVVTNNRGSFWFQIR